MEFYKFKSEAMYTSFRDSCKTNRKIAEDITQHELLPWHTVFDLIKVHDACYVNDKCTPGLYFHPSEVNKYLEKVTRQTLEKESPSEPEGFRLEDLDKTVYISEPKSWDIKIEGHFDKDGIKSIIAKL